MPRPKGDFDQAAYTREYLREKIIYKKMSLNRGNPDDMEMADWLDEQPEGVSSYLKRLVLADMEARRKPDRG